jgi:hypothetical protein
LETRHASHDDSGSVSSATELKVFFDHILQLLLQLNQVSGRRWDYWGRSICFARRTSSFDLASVPEKSVFMSAALRVAKKLRVATSLEKVFKEGDESFCTATFFEVPAVPSVARRFRFRTLGNHPPVLFVALLFLVG